MPMDPKAFEIYGVDRTRQPNPLEGFTPPPRQAVPQSVLRYLTGPVPQVPLYRQPDLVVEPPDLAMMPGASRSSMDEIRSMTPTDMLAPIGEKDLSPEFEYRNVYDPFTGEMTRSPARKQPKQGAYVGSFRGRG